MNRQPRVYSTDINGCCMSNFMRLGRLGRSAQAGRLEASTGQGATKVP
jgi:hypothetical protein